MNCNAVEMNVSYSYIHNDAKRNCYRAMHFSAKRGIVIACRLSVCLWRWWIVIT